MAVGDLRVRSKAAALHTRIRQHKIAYAFIAPAVLMMLLVHIIPTVQALYMSTLDLKQANLRQYLAAPSIGFGHYTKIISGLVTGEGSGNIKDLGQALVNTTVFALGVNGGVLAIGMVMALLLNRTFRGRGLARTIMLLPWIMPTFVVGLIWRYIWLQQGGLANRVLVDWLGVVQEPITWLVGANARVALMIPAIWRGVPLMGLMLLAGLQSIPVDLYEASGIDGANAWQRFRYITLPLLKPIIAIQLMFGMVFNFFGFGPYNIAVSQFGGTNHGTYAELLIPAIARQTFSNQLYGYGAAASVLMMIVAMVFVVVWYRAFRSSLTAE